MKVPVLLLPVFLALVCVCVLGGWHASAQSSGYDSTVALRAVYYCAAAYCNPSTVSNWSCGTPCSTLPGVLSGSTTPLEFSQTTSTQATFGFAAYNANYNEIVISFRGTDGMHLNSESIANWITNLDAVQTPYSTTTASGATPMVHQGFYNAYLGVQQQLLGELEQLMNQYPSAGILVTGHSLGAALACFAAMDIVLNVQPSTEFAFYTFGSPRVGDSNWVELFNENIPSNSAWRVVHYYDIVPHLPMEDMGYLHVEPEIWYNEASSSYQESQTSIPSYGDSVADHVDYLNVQLTSICSTSYGDSSALVFANPNSYKANKNWTGVIVGSVVGGVAFLALVAVVAVVMIRRRRATNKEPQTGPYTPYREMSATSTLSESLVSNQH